MIGELRSLEKRIMELTALSRQFARISTSTISDVMDKLGIHGILSGFQSIPTGKKIAGPAMTVRELSGRVGEYSFEDFRIGDVLDNAELGDVIVFDNGGRDVSTWGSLASLAAQLKGIKGVVVHGAVRDIDEIRNLGFPVFAEHVVPTSGKGRLKIESINIAIRIRDVEITPGDIIVGDGTGIAVVPQERCHEILEEAERLEKLEGIFVSRVKKRAHLSELSREYGHV